MATALHLDPTATYRIKKYLYGLPDAGLAYYKAYSSYLIAGGFTRTVSDPCLFVKTGPLGTTYVWCHVDDTFICATSKHLITEFTDYIKKAFDITIEAADEYLGLKLTTTEQGCLLTQPKLLSQLEVEYQLLLAPFTRATTPQRPLDSQDSNDSPFDSTEYLHLLGSLIYLTKSRPEIATAVSFGARHGSSPTRGQFSELLHCLAYLLRTRDQGLLLRRGTPGQSLRLHCYADASYLTHGDTSQSHAGYCLAFGELGSFYSKSQTIKLVVTSSTHAELRALYAVTIDIVFVMHLCAELHRPLALPSIVFIDNQPVIDVINATVPRPKRSKHFLMLADWLRDQVSLGYIELQKIPTAFNLSDILTKIVTGSAFKTKAALLLGL